MVLFQAQRLDSIGTLAAGIAHDLSNILTPVIVISQLLKMKLPDREKQTSEMLEIIESNGKRGAALVKQILEFTPNGEEKRITMQLTPVLDEVRQIVTNTFSKSIELQTYIPQDLWTVCGNFNQLYQVILNLCINAQDAMPNGGILRISAENLFRNQNFVQRDRAAEAEAFVVITVSDTGIGIPPENLDRIFDPFFTTKDKGIVRGLGLSTVAGIVKSHSGLITVSSQVGQGTQFQVFLPALVD